MTKSLSKNIPIRKPLTRVSKKKKKELITTNVPIVLS